MTAVCHLIQDRIHQPLHVRPHGVDATGAERFCNKATQTGVIGRIGVEYGAAVPVLKTAGGHIAFRTGRRLLAEAPILQDEIDVFEAAGVPGALWIFEEALPAYRLVGRVGVLEVGGQIVGTLSHFHSSSLRPTFQIIESYTAFARLTPRGSPTM